MFSAAEKLRSEAHWDAGIAKILRAAALRAGNVFLGGPKTEVQKIVIRHD
jgi:hypothetical protein